MSSSSVITQTVSQTQPLLVPIIEKTGTMVEQAFQISAQNMQYLVDQLANYVVREESVESVNIVGAGNVITVPVNFAKDLANYILSAQKREKTNNPSLRQWNNRINNLIKSYMKKRPQKETTITTTAIASTGETVVNSIPSAVGGATRGYRGRVGSIMNPNLMESVARAGAGVLGLMGGWYLSGTETQEGDIVKEVKSTPNTEQPNFEPAHKPKWMPKTDTTESQYVEPIKQFTQAPYPFIQQSPLEKPNVVVEQVAPAAPDPTASRWMPPPRGSGDGDDPDDDDNGKKNNDKKDDLPEKNLKQVNDKNLNDKIQKLLPKNQQISGVYILKEGLFLVKVVVVGGVTGGVIYYIFNAATGTINAFTGTIHAGKELIHEYGKIADEINLSLLIILAGLALYYNNK